MGNTCKSMADLWQKPLQYCKVIGLQLIKKRKKERKLWYTDTMEYYSAIKKNTFESVLMRWMKLEPVIQSEVSQKKNTNNSILTHIYEIQKDGNDNPVCKTAKETQMYRTDFWTLGEGEGV